MAVAATGKHYGIEGDIIFSFPVHIKDGKYTIVDNLPQDDFSKAAMEKTYNELKEELGIAQEILSQ